MPARNNLSDWAKRLKARPAVEHGLTAIDKFIRREILKSGLVGLNGEHRSQLFDEAQYERYR